MRLKNNGGVMVLSLVLVFTLGVLEAGLGQETLSPAEARHARESRRDLHSFARPGELRVTNVDLDLSVDFGAKQISGTARLSFDRQKDCPPDAQLVLDTRDLTINSVKVIEGDSEVARPFELGRRDPILGSPLRIQVSEKATGVVVSYTTSPEASALQWLEPAQTRGGKSPFLFTQSQAIHARSWIPLQDSPVIRVTYRAKIHVPEGLQAVMSADSKGRDDSGAFLFEMPQAIPPYLIAMAVGELAFRPLGDRTGVWAEPSLIGSAAAEFVDTERMLEAGERLCGPYRWGRYDLLVLPPSFPFGGMENAKLTFVTPTILAGDRSLVPLIAHELAHSWSGNLVTGATWRDFWLNEGFTTYLERRIVEELYGAERAAMEAVLGRQELQAELKRFAASEEVLNIDLRGRDPDEGMTSVPYEKGALFLTALEKAVGRERFDAFLKEYFDHFAFQSITTADFEHFVRTRLFPNEPGVAEPVDLHAWLHRPGLPPDAPVPTSERFATISDLADRWTSGKISAAELDAAGWSTLEWLQFLKSLPARLPTEKLAELDQAYHLTGRENSEIAFQWLLMSIRAGYRPADQRLETFLTTIGRRKFILPLYEELAKTAEGRRRARGIFAVAKPGYHPIATRSVQEILEAD